MACDTSRQASRQELTHTSHGTHLGADRALLRSCSLDLVRPSILQHVQQLLAGANFQRHIEGGLSMCVGAEELWVHLVWSCSQQCNYGLCKDLVRTPLDAKVCCAYLQSPFFGSKVHKAVLLQRDGRAQVAFSVRQQAVDTIDSVDLDRPLVPTTAVSAWFSKRAIPSSNPPASHLMSNAAELAHLQSVEALVI